MAYLPEENTYEAGIYQLELTDKVMGGADGISNLQGKQLANRTKYLKSETDRLETEKVAVNTKGQANGVASLDANGRIPYSQLPESAMEYKGTWDASTNTPALADGTGNTGDMYIVSVAGIVDFGSGDITFYEGDRVVYNGSVWQRVAGSKEVETRLAKFYPYLYTGRNLVEVFGVSTAVQAFAKLKEKSDAGDFSGLGIGDYINIPSIVIGGNTISYNDTYQNLRAEIVAFDQYYRNGDTDITDHHIIMQMKNCPLTHRINESNDNTGGWASSELKTYLSNTVAGAIEDAIGISLKTIRRILSTHGSWAWVAEKCFLPSEVECIGTKAWSDNYGYTVGNCRQWAMFQLRPDRLIKFYNGVRQWWWTCSDSTSNSTDFVYVDNYGNVDNVNASNGSGVPFAFAI